MNPISMVGERYGSLTVLELDVGKSSGRRKYWICSCECGQTTSVRGDALKSGHITSCGCKKIQMIDGLAVSWQVINLHGRVFGKLTVLKLISHGRNKVMWLCKCECGTVKAHRATHLLAGATISCGCAIGEAAAKIFVHKESKTPEYRVWNSMIMRCTNPNVKAYKNYGGRGVMVFPSWRKYENWKADVCPIPKGKSMERRYNHGHYEPMNVGHATPKEQANNTRKPVRIAGKRGSAPSEVVRADPYFLGLNLRLMFNRDPQKRSWQVYQEEHGRLP